MTSTGARRSVNRHLCQLGRYDKTIVSDKSLTRGPDPLLSIGSQRQLCCTCMATVQRPFGLTVTDDEDSRGGHGDWMQADDGLPAPWDLLAKDSCAQWIT